MNNETFDLNEDRIYEVVETYVVKRDEYASKLRARKTTHSEFIRFCNDYSCKLNQVMGNLPDYGLMAVLMMARAGQTPFTESHIITGFIELLECQIAYLAVMKKRKAEMN